MIEQKIRKNKEVLALIRKGNDNLGAMGYTDHSKAHAAMVADRAAYILKKLDYPEKDIELVKIAGWMHDIGNAINRTHHAEYGACLLYTSRKTDNRFSRSIYNNFFLWNNCHNILHDFFMRKCVALSLIHI